MFIFPFGDAAALTAHIDFEIQPNKKGSVGRPPRKSGRIRFNYDTIPSLNNV